MKKLILISLLTISSTVTADVLVDLKKCSLIKNNSNRLDCFDSVSQFYNKLNQSKDESKSLNTKKNIEKNEIVKPNNDMISISKTEAFGKTTTELSDLESIKSHIMGEFKGWIKGDVITLLNGQKWKVTSNDSGYVNLLDPEVEITTGFWGSFNMKVTGLNAQAKVKRVD